MTTTTTEKTWLIRIPHLAGKATVEEFDDIVRGAIRDRANQGDGLESEDDDALVDYVRRDAHAAFILGTEALARSFAELAAGRGVRHRAEQVMVATHELAEREPELLALLDKLAPEAVRRIESHVDWGSFEGDLYREAYLAERGVEVEDMGDGTVRLNATVHNKRDLWRSQRDGRWCITGGEARDSGDRGWYVIEVADD